MNKDVNSAEIQYITFKGKKNGFILKPFKNKVGQAAIDHLKESKDDEKQKIRRDFNDRFAGEILNEIMHGEEYKNLRNKINKKRKEVKEVYKEVYKDTVKELRESSVKELRESSVINRYLKREIFNFLEEHKFPIWGVKHESKKLTYKQIMEFNENACEEYKAQKNLEMILNFNTETGDFEELKRYLLESISEKIDINGIKLDQKQDNEFKRNVQEMSQYSDVNAEELYNKLSSDSINLLKNPLMLMMQFVNVQGTKQKSAKEAIKNVQKQNNSDFKNLIEDVKQIHKGLSNGQNSLKDDTNKFGK